MREFNSSDHAEIYNYADLTQGERHLGGCKIGEEEANILPRRLATHGPLQYPVQIRDALTPTARTAAARFRRAKAIMQAHFAK